MDHRRRILYLGIKMIFINSFDVYMQINVNKHIENKNKSRRTIDRSETQCISFIYQNGTSHQ